MKVLYIHIRLDTKKIFYVGIGTKQRAYSKHNRNNIWKKITKKTKYIVKILKENLTPNKAKKLEIKLISKYGKLCDKTGILANITDGGDNINSNSYISKKISNSLKGRKLTKKHKQNISKAHRNKKLSYKTKEKIKLALENKNPNSRKVINTNNGKIYKSIRKASVHSKYSYSALRAMLNGQNINKSNFIKI